MAWTERQVEAWIEKELKKLGYLYYKFVSPGNSGVPDRIMVSPHGNVTFVELKTEIGKLSEVQNVQISRIEHHGASVVIVYGEAGAKQFIEVVRGIERVYNKTGNSRYLGRSVFR